MTVHIQNTDIFINLKIDFWTVFFEIHLFGILSYPIDIESYLIISYHFFVSFQLSRPCCQPMVLLRPYLIFTRQDWVLQTMFLKWDEPIQSGTVSRIFWDEMSFGNSCLSIVHSFVSIQKLTWWCQFWTMSNQDISSFFEQTKIEI